MIDSGFRQGNREWTSPEGWAVWVNPMLEQCHSYHELVAYAGSLQGLLELVCRHLFQLTL